MCACVCVCKRERGGILTFVEELSVVYRNSIEIKFFGY